MLRRKKVAGRTSKLTPEVQKAICDAIRIGGYIETAVSYVGISKETFYQWMKRGAAEIDRRRKFEEVRQHEKEIEEDQSRRKPYAMELKRRRERDEIDVVLKEQEQAFATFADSVKKATAEAELGLLGVVTRSAKGSHVVARSVVDNPDGTTTTSEKFSRPEWQAAAWCLERRHPEKWGRRQVEMVGADGGRLEVKLSWSDAIKETFAKVEQDRRQEKDIVILKPGTIEENES
jgi:hypothetical protein